MSATDEEKRSYYRIRDLVELCWTPAKLDEPTGTELQVQMRDLSNQIGDLINSAHREVPAIAQALGLLNRKIDLLFSDNAGTTQFVWPVQVVLSGAGLGFAWASAIPIQALIDIRIRLKPSNVEVTLRTLVLDCVKNQETKGGFWVRGKFIDSQEPAVEQIVRHVAFLQSQRLAASRDAEIDD